MHSYIHVLVITAIQYIQVMARTEVDFDPFYLDTEGCRDMFPTAWETDAVNANKSERFIPYAINFEPTTYQANSRITVTLTAKAKNREYNIRGAVLQARVADCSDPDYDRPIGTFQHMSGGFLDTIQCPISKPNGVAARRYTKGDKGQKDTQIQWSPVDGKENRTIYFIATIVYDKKVFYSGITSAFLRHSSSKNEQGETCPIRLTYLEVNRSSRQSSVSLMIICLCVFVRILR